MQKKFPGALLMILALSGLFGKKLWAQPSNYLQAKGLTANVKILRDNEGVNHIYAANQHDLFFAQGYCAAKDRLFQFEIWRRQATGTLAEILGARELKRDIGMRLFTYQGNMKQELAHYHPQGEAIIMAYTAGINAYVDYAVNHKKLLPIEFKLLKILPGKWTVKDVVSRHQGILRNVSEELNIARAVTAVGEDKVKKMMQYYPKDPLLTMDTAIDATLLSADILGLYEAFRKDVIFLPEDIDPLASNAKLAIASINDEVKIPQNTPFQSSLEGSNNWVVSGKKSASGYPMMADDPHRKVAVPSLRYMVHLVAPGWNVLGAGEPTIPGVSIGHNQHGAWGITIFDTDGEDLYVYDVNPTDLTQYRYNDKWKKMDSIQETITVKNAATVNVILRYTVHGPVTFIDSVHHKAYAVKAAWLQPGGAPYLSALRIDQATSWSQFREACSFNNLPALNMVWADKKGNIGWQVTGLAPIRKNYSGMVPVPGDGRYEWSGCLPIKERPHFLNPAKGFIATANQQLTPPNYTHWNAMGFTWPDAFRGKRLNELLSKDSSVTISKMKAMQSDYYSVPAQMIVPMLKDVNVRSATAIEAKKKMLGWNFTMDKNSVAAGIYFMWEQQILRQANAQFLDSPLNKLLSIQLEKVIIFLSDPAKAPYQIFGVDAVAGKNIFIQTTFENAVNALVAKLGSDVNKWQLGQDKYRHIQFIHPLAGLVKDSIAKKLNTGVLPRGGYAYTIGNTGNTDNQNNGASFKIIADTKDWDNTLMINTPGQSGDAGSGFYQNLFMLWGSDEYFPAYYSIEKIKKVTKEITVLQPVK